MLCEWCGAVHDPAALCHARPRWTRRGFLALALTGGAALVIAPLMAQIAAPVLPTITDESIGEIVARAWVRHVQGPEDDIFTSYYLLTQLKKENATHAPFRSSVYDVRVDWRRDRRALRESALSGVRRCD